MHNLRIYVKIDVFVSLPLKINWRIIDSEFIEFQRGEDTTDTFVDAGTDQWSKLKYDWCGLPDLIERLNLYVQFSPMKRELLRKYVFFLV